MSIAAALGLAYAQDTFVENHCNKTLYIQSFPYKASSSGPLATVKPGEYFGEAFRYDGSTVKISTTKLLEDPLFVDYFFSNDKSIAYYSLEDQYGNPVADKHNTLGAGDGCDAFDCAANDASCYSTANNHIVYACPRPINITAKLCV
ncbi:hypothetical protein LEL_10958 [Akanthomyces lecanii RCEF 1005]|uniref:16 kDa allergen n=1 Tax=Akanthomyces lecanii RCEF 1005 TaxID=1081108 RepID=A0A167PK76_CORDF|nr:hypothetical protein LEL_10958 [Akanthomyces lecanii RCEF 1005]